MPADRPNRRIRLVALALCAGLTASLLGAPATGAAPVESATAASARHVASPAQDDQGSSELKGEYDEAVGEEAELLVELDRASARSKQASDQLRELQAKTKVAQAQLVEAQKALTEAEGVLTRRLAARRQAERRVDVAQDRLRQQIVASYVAGGDHDGLLEALLNAGTNEEVGQALAYGRAISGSTEALVRRLDAARAQQAKAAKQARIARQQAREARDDIETSAKFLAASADKQGKLVSELNLRVLAEAVALRKVQGRKAVIEGRINAMNVASDGIGMILAVVQKDQPDWVPGSVSPISTPVPGVKIGSAYGLRHHPILGIDRLHAGVDLGGATGTPIHAAADGVVVLAEVRGGYGNAVVIDHGNSLATLYGHNSKLLVKAGDVVHYGDVIALMGSTGLSTGPHSHFETRVKGLPIDPTSVVSDFGEDVDYDAGD